MPKLLHSCTTALMLGIAAIGAAAEKPEQPAAGGFVPDIREEPLPASARKGNYMLVPIPFSNPTLDSGLVGVAAYFHPQTEAQQAVQPPSVTGLGAMYSGNGSYGIALGHSSYWNEDRWRLKGAVGYADLELPLLAPANDENKVSIDWLISSTFFYSEISRRVADHWYLGVSGRWIDIDQVFSIEISEPGFELGNSLKTIGLGLSLGYDTRDLPTNAYKGQYLTLAAIFNNDSVGGNSSYQSYSLAYRSYHRLRNNLVLAWEAAGCMRSDQAPLWDACRLGIRGPASTDYLGKSSYRAQVEARWKFSKRWGAVAFAGAGRISETLSGNRNNETIPSLGVGLRFMVQQANRVNMRLDFAKSKNSEAIILSVMEAF